MQRIGLSLRELRLQRNLPLEVACRKAGVSIRTWRLWEVWGLPPKRRETAARIASLFDLTPEQLGWREGGDSDDE